MRKTDAASRPKELTGLYNMGCNCFANASLQFVRAMEPECRQLLDSSPVTPQQLVKGSKEWHKDQVNQKNFRTNAKPALYRFFNGEVRTEPQSVNLRKEVWECLPRRKDFPQTSVRGYAKYQADAQEFLDQMLEAMGWPVIDVKNVISLRSNDHVFHTIEKSGAEDGHFLNLPIQGARSVQEAFERFTSPERIGYEWVGDTPDMTISTSRFAPVEKDKEIIEKTPLSELRTEKQLVIDNPPDPLIIGLKRMEFSREIGTHRKDDIVEFNRLTFPGRDGKRDRVFEPEAVICHSGRADFGHYYTYRKIKGVWWKFNDLTVSKATQRDLDAMRQEAYVLLYREVKEL